MDTTTPDPEICDDHLGIEEMSVSRTDKRGQIRFGNGVFRRSSGYSWDRLRGAPHRIIRSPDMPKGLFWLMWKAIQQDRPIAVFLKNQAADGRSFWVLATIVPLEDGFLTAQIKPTGTLFEKIRLIYTTLLAAETAHGLTPEASANLFQDRLGDLGMTSYAELAALALQEELALRDATLGRNDVAKLQALQTIVAALTPARAEQDLLLHEFTELQSIPTNMRIIASRLEPSGGPISAISDNYKFASTEISRQLHAFAGNKSNLCQQMADMVTEALILTSIDRLLNEMPGHFGGQDPIGSDTDLGKEVASLTKVQKLYAARKHDVLSRAEYLSTELNVSSAEIRRMMLGLDTIRVMGRVESGRLGNAGGGLASTIDQLDTRHGEIAVRLQRLMDFSATVKTGISAFQRRGTTTSHTRTAAMGSGA